MTSLWRFLTANEETGVTLQIDAVRPMEDRIAEAFMRSLYKKHGEPGVVVQGERFDGRRWVRKRWKFKK